jgi:hypothetical protein
MGSGRIFLKTFRTSLFKMKTYRMSLISAGFVSLEVPLKGLSHEIDFKNVVENGQILALKVDGNEK